MCFGATASSWPFQVRVKTRQPERGTSVVLGYISPEVEFTGDLWSTRHAKWFGRPYGGTGAVAGGRRGAGRPRRAVYRY
ncbi:hypothetical protein Airi01_046280 [Actinoallomurus iriomotensis]|uniref:Uncharacterized protein n=1 Tax=Actinoallomurus iriomotensis TaxID=478107 RepID=A0A9W6RHW8_9ACTN|nr:hypothetical protein Airi01_046280 [Actinoallomurus iriomotensis]